MKKRSARDNTEVSDDDDNNDDNNDDNDGGKGSRSDGEQHGRYEMRVLTSKQLYCDLHTYI